jgi:hypothetical protein
MKLMKADHPGWIMLGCTAHALNLLIKDFASPKRGACKWLTKVYDTAIMMSNTINNADKVRAALDHHQQQRGDGKVKAISRHTPTRFGTIHFICKDLHRERAPIKAMVIADGDDGEDDMEEAAPSWAAVSKDSEHRESFYKAVIGGTEQVKQPFEACQPLLQVFTTIVYYLDVYMLVYLDCILPVAFDLQYCTS